MSNTSSTTIERLQCRYLVHQQHPAPEEVRSRLDGVARDYLADACSRWLSRFLDPHDPSVWLIRELLTDLSLDVGDLDNHELAELWGRQVALCIIQAIAAGVNESSLNNSDFAEAGGDQFALRSVHDIAASTSSDTIKYYRNQAVYVAHFVADLVGGRAWGKWYYRLFESVSSLSTGAAIRTVMTREPEQIDEILLQLAAMKRLEPVLHSLGEYDALVIYEQGVPTTSAIAGRSVLVELAISAWASAALELSSKRLATPHNALRLYAAMRGRTPALDANGMRETIDHLLRFAEVLRAVAQPARLVAHLIANELTEALQMLQDVGMIPSLESQPFLPQTMEQRGSNPAMISYLESLSYLQQVAPGDEALIRRVAATIGTSVAMEKFRTSQNPGRPDASNAAAATGASLIHQAIDTTRPVQKPGHPDTVGATGTSIQSFTTLAGGLFLLMPSFLDLKLHELIEAAPYPALPEGQVAAVLLYLLCLKCFGLLYSQWPDVAGDPALLLLAGLEEAPSTEDLLDLGRSSTAAMNAAFQQTVLERLARYRHLDGRHLYVELVEGTADDAILLMRDMKHDVWVYASYLPTGTSLNQAIRDILMQGLALLQKTVDIWPEYLVFGPGFEKQSDLDEFEILSQGLVQPVWTGQVLLPDALSHQAGKAGEDGNDAITLWTRARALPQEVQALFVRYLKRLQSASRDLGYLRLGGPQQTLTGNRDLDLAWSLIARALMRAFALRLMGFDQSSMPYLYRNFLAGTSTVHLQQDLVEVQLPCSPLHTILRMAGVHGQSYALPWLNDTQVTLALSC